MAKKTVKVVARFTLEFRVDESVDPGNLGADVLMNLDDRDVMKALMANLHHIDDCVLVSTSVEESE